jgi:hypothetical protein
MHGVRVVVVGGVDDVSTNAIDRFTGWMMINAFVLGKRRRLQSHYHSCVL